jgi:pSer/pThr/pTyr-binding forkhead associated (FHA) protein
MGSNENLLTETPYLIAQSGPLQGERWILQRDRFLIGRGPECDIVVPDRQISRQHARLSRTADGIQVEDLGSKNGTHVNGARIEAPMLLQDGDVVQVAFTLELVFVSRRTLPLEGRLGEALAMDAAAIVGWRERKSPPLSARSTARSGTLSPAVARRPAREIIGHVWRTPPVPAVGTAVDVRRLRDRLAKRSGPPYVVTVRGTAFGSTIRW